MIPAQSHLILCFFLREQPLADGVDVVGERPGVHVVAAFENGVVPPTKKSTCLLQDVDFLLFMQHGSYTAVFFCRCQRIISI